MKDKKFSLFEIKQKIREKKEFRNLEDSVIDNILTKYLSKHQITKRNFPTSSAKIIIKEVRSELRYLVGQYQKGRKNRDDLITANRLEELLKTHASTAERLEFYPALRKIINQINPKSILDLGCGLNPIALAKPNIAYYAVDIKKDELDLVKKYLDKKKIKGKVFAYNLQDSKKPFPRADLCLIFKVLDVIDDRKHKLSERLIKRIRCKIILASFSTKKLSGKKMNFPERFWFEKMLKKLNLPFKKFHSQNEVFYLIEKSDSTRRNK